MNKIGIVIKPNHPERKPILAKLTRWLLDYKKKVVIIDPFLKKGIPPVDLMIVLGGDGTLLSVARLISSHEIPILAVNLGSLGFLAEIDLDDLYPTLTQIFKNEHQETPREMLQCIVFRGRKQIRKQTVLNDIVVNKGSFARLIQINVTIDRQFVTHLRGDGLIVSSATGSTAYTLSAGGPIVHPSVSAMILTPIAPHTLTTRPIVVPASVEVRVTLKSLEAGPVVTFDGQELFPLQPNDQVCIRTADRQLRLIRSSHLDYYQRLREKLHWGV